VVKFGVEEALFPVTGRRTDAGPARPVTLKQERMQEEVLTGVDAGVSGRVLRMVTWW
jgi:hypothetical protein